MSDTSAGEVTAPVFPMLPKDVVCNSGEKITLKCQVQGTPVPVVQWYREGILIESSPDYQVRSFYFYKFCSENHHLAKIFY